MLSILFSLALNALVSLSPAPQACEWTRPTIEGISSKVCSGSVVAKRDALGTVVVFADWR